MSRAIIVGPLARDLAEEYRANIVPIPNAQTATLRAWDTMDREYFISLGQPDLSIYTSLADVPVGLRLYLFMVRASPTSLAVNAPAWSTAPLMQMAMVPAAHYIRVLASGVPTVKQRSAVVAGDVPIGRRPVHEWSGQAHTLGGVDSSQYGRRAARSTAR